ncbi:MAG: hypothetical protein R3C68_00105 [Myxococcota bacterium]
MAKGPSLRAALLIILPLALSRRYGGGGVGVLARANPWDEAALRATVTRYRGAFSRRRERSTHL